MRLRWRKAERSFRSRNAIALFSIRNIRRLRYSLTNRFRRSAGMGRLNGQGWEAFAVMMGQFARLLSDYADRKVVDRTGLSGTYDIHFNLSPEDLGVSPDAAPNDGPAVGPADVFARVRASVHKIGLRLEPSRAPEDMLMIDAAETPCGN
jgi:uncharacterized protein (TIGR03435 family)